MKNSKYKINYLPSFDLELEEILNYIVFKLKNKEAAKRLIEKIDKAIIDRSNKPEGFEKYKSNKEREHIWYRIYVNNYTIFYTFQNNLMEVAHIIYKKRNLKTLI